MDYLQYLLPDDLMPVGIETGVLNLVINGLPSIPKGLETAFMFQNCLF